MRRHAEPPPAPAASPPLLPVQRPQLPPPEAIFDYYRASVDSGWFANGGPCAQLLARRIEERLGGHVFGVPVANCTAGLMAALRAACGAPDAGRRLVLTPSFTFTATAGAIEWAGFEPAFVDIEPDGWHLDPVALDEALEHFGSAVAGVLACSTFGSAPTTEQRAAWRAACERHGVPLIVDSAPGFGSVDEHGCPLGAAGDTEVFSFHATKPFACGEGGMVVTADAELAAHVARLVNFGLEPGTRTSTESGFNGKMSELHAATGLAMLDRLDAVLRTRRERAARLHAEIGHDRVAIQRGAAGSAWQFFHGLLPDAAQRARLVELAEPHAVQLRTLHDPPLHRHPAYARHPRRDLTVTEDIAARSVAMPMANDLADDEIARIATLVGAAG